MLQCGTSHLKIPSGTTAQRLIPAVGMIRHNTTQSEYEVYTGSTWNSLTRNYSIEYLVVAGGMVVEMVMLVEMVVLVPVDTDLLFLVKTLEVEGWSGTLLNLSVGSVYTITVGGGGIGTYWIDGQGCSNSVFGEIVSIGGGGGGV